MDCIDSPQVNNFQARVRSVCRVAAGACRLVGLLLAFLPSYGTCYGQSLVVTSGGQPVNQGDTISINTIPNMPNLVLSVDNGGSCDTVNYIIDISYIDQDGYETKADWYPGDYPGDQAVTIDWNGYLEGGTVEISWAYNGTAQPDFSFFINGLSPSVQAVDSYASSGPWFTYNLITAESNYYQYDALGYPTWGAPDGIGLMQLEPPNRFSLDEDYWVWSENVADGLQVIKNILATNGPNSGPYTYWTNEYKDMVSNTSGHPVAANWPSDCVNHANGAVCGGFSPAPYFYCSFSSSSSNGSPNGFGDGNWIHAYNGSYFVDWVDGVNGATGHWEYDVQGPRNGYVYKVCTSPPQY